MAKWAQIATRVVEGVARDYVVEIIPAARYASLPVAVQAIFEEVSDDAEPGYLLVDDEWTAPPTPDPVQPAPAASSGTVITRIQFMQLFSISEQAALRAKGRIAPDHQNFDANFDAFWQMLNDPQLTEVNLGHAMTVTGVNYLESISLIGEGRAAEILANTAPS